MSDKPTIGERAVLICNPQTLELSVIRNGPVRWLERQQAANIDALVAEHVAAKDSEIKRLREELERLNRSINELRRRIVRNDHRCSFEISDLDIEAVNNPATRTAIRQILQPEAP